MTDNIVRLGMITKMPLPVERVLTNDEALALDEVLVIGWEADGSFYFGASDADTSRALMLLACAERWIIDQKDLS